MLLDNEAFRQNEQLYDINRLLDRLPTDLLLIQHIHHQVLFLLWWQ
jgi:hypothetical protein